MTCKRDVEVALADYQKLVSVEEKGNQIIVKLKEYIRDKNKWNKIDNILRTDYNGKYIPKAQGGPEWQLPASSEAKQTEKPQQNSIEYYAKRLDGIFDELARVREEMAKEVQLKKKREAS